MRHADTTVSKSPAATASDLAGEICGLVSLRAGVADQQQNTTRFVIMQREPFDPDP
jgi:prephenate dehydratase